MRAIGPPRWPSQICQAIPHVRRSRNRQVLVTTGGIIGAIGGSWLLQLATQPDEHDQRRPGPDQPEHHQHDRDRFHDATLWQR